MKFKEDWQLDDVVEPSDANRWESNTKEIYNMISETQKMTGDVDVTAKGNLQQQIDDTKNACAKGEGIEFSVVDGILTVTYDDGTEEEIEEEGDEE